MIGSAIPGQVRSACSQIRALEADKVVGAGTPGHEFFVRYREQVRGAIHLAGVLETCDFDNTPDDILARVLEKTHAIHAALNVVMGQHNSGRNSSDRDGAANTLVRTYREWYDEAAPIVAFSRARGTDILEMERQVLEARDRLKTLRAEAEEIHRSLKDYEVRNVVSKQASFFADQAKVHKAGGTIWLSMLVVVAVLLAGGAIYTMISPPEPTDKASLLVSQWAPRIALASILFWGLALCSRNYRAHRHNEVTNGHRALSLQTFNVFVSSAEDPSVRSAILAQAASTIFSAAPSGYSPDQADPLPHVTAVELLQKLVK